MKNQKTVKHTRASNILGVVIFLLIVFGLAKCVSSCNESANVKRVFDQNDAFVAVEMAVRKNLNDPDSFERVERGAWLQDSASHKYRVRLTYRAKNAFGGVATNNQLFEVDSTYMVKLIE